MAAGKNIRKTCGLGNAAGISNVMWITKKNEVTSIATATSGKISGATAFTMATAPNPGSFNVFDLSPINSKKTLEITPVGDADSPAWTVTLTGFHPKMEGSKSDILTSLAGCEYIVVFQDKNGKRWLIGDTIDAAYITVKSMINDGSNGYEITVTLEVVKHFPYEIADDVALTVAADV